MHISTLPGLLFPHLSGSDLPVAGDDKDDWHDARESIDRQDLSLPGESSGLSKSDSGDDVSEEEDSGDDDEGGGGDGDVFVGGGDRRDAGARSGACR